MFKLHISSKKRALTFTYHFSWDFHHLFAHRKNREYKFRSFMLIYPSTCTGFLTSNFKSTLSCISETKYKSQTYYHDFLQKQK